MKRPSGSVVDRRERARALTRTVAPPIGDAAVGLDHLAEHAAEDGGLHVVGWNEHLRRPLLEQTEAGLQRHAGPHLHDAEGELGLDREMLERLHAQRDVRDHRKQDHRRHALLDHVVVLALLVVVVAAVVGVFGRLRLAAVVLYGAVVERLELVLLRALALAEATVSRE